MFPPDTVFCTASSLMLPCWLALAGSLFVPASRIWIWRITSMIVPAFLAVAYVLLILQGFGEAPGGGFGSIEQVRLLFASDAALTAGWLHYLAFDLFIGTWILRSGLGLAMHPLLLLACLPVTFLLGPAGLLLFLFLRATLERHDGAAT